MSEIVPWFFALGVHEDRRSRYVTSNYWVYTTLSTLGYGDIYGNTNTELMFTMVIEFMGIFVFAYMMGNINNLVSHLNESHTRIIDEQKEELE